MDADFENTCKVSQGEMYLGLFQDFMDGHIKS